MRGDRYGKEKKKRRKRTKGKKKTNHIKLACLNIQLKRKYISNELQEIVKKEGIDIVCMQETGTRGIGKPKAIDGYKRELVNRERGDKKGGGLEILIKKGIKYISLS